MVYNRKCTVKEVWGEKDHQMGKDARKKKGTWGGRRSGAGRPKGRKAERERISITFTKEAMEHLRRLAAADSKSISTYIRDNLDIRTGSSLD